MKGDIKYGNLFESRVKIFIEEINKCTANDVLI
jgi:hypothetical protein